MIGRRRRWRSTAATIVGSTIVAVGPACTARRPASRVVKIQNFVFAPAVVTVSVGDTVVWTNADFVPHTASARDGAWDSKTIAGDSAWRLVARAPGKHAYYCVFHPNMQGTVEVR